MWLEFYFMYFVQFQKKNIEQKKSLVWVNRTRAGIWLRLEFGMPIVMFFLLLTTIRDWAL